VLSSALLKNELRRPELEESMKTDRSKSKMKPTEKKLPTFVRGQKWQMPRGHAEIVQVGKTLVHYKFLKTGMIRGSIEMKSIRNFADALHTNKAKLIVESSRP
jgi:hypothetical protein